MTVKYVCMVDALYEYKRLFGKHEGRDILSYLCIVCEIILKWMFIVGMVTVLCGVMYVFTMQSLFVSTVLHSVTSQQTVGFVATAMTQWHFTVFVMDSTGCK